MDSDGKSICIIALSFMVVLGLIWTMGLWQGCEPEAEGAAPAKSDADEARRKMDDEQLRTTKALITNATRCEQLAAAALAGTKGFNRVQARIQPGGDLGYVAGSEAFVQQQMAKARAIAAANAEAQRQAAQKNAEIAAAQAAAKEKYEKARKTADEARIAAWNGYLQFWLYVEEHHPEMSPGTEQLKLIRQTVQQVRRTRSPGTPEFKELKLAADRVAVIPAPIVAAPKPDPKPMTKAEEDWAWFEAECRMLDEEEGFTSR